MSFEAGGAAQGAIGGASAGASFGPWGAAIGGIAGGLLGGFAGGGGKNDAKKIAREQMAQQERFAKEALSWRVADAKNAGIHPLYAMGAQLPSYSPVNYIADSVDGGGVGGALAAGGQDIGRAVDALLSRPERADARMHGARMADLTEKRAELENTLLASQIAKLNQAGQPPARPDFVDHGLAETAIPGQGGMPGVEVKPIEVRPSHPSMPGHEIGVQNYLRWVKLPSGRFRAMPAEGMGLNDLELDNPEAAEFWLKNRVAPSFGGGDPPPDALLPKGAEGWWWNSTDGGWEPFFEHDTWMPGLARKMPWFRPRR